MKEDIKQKIKDLEGEMQAPDFWNDKEKAQVVIKQLNDLKSEKQGFSDYDNSNAVLTIFSGWPQIFNFQPKIQKI